MKRLVLLGGGHAHVEVLRDFAERPQPDCSITLVTPYPWLVYSGMVPGVFAGHYALEDCTIDLAALAFRANAKTVYSAATRLDAGRREIGCANSSTIAYDVLSMDVGSAPNIGRTRGVPEHAILIRPLEQAVKAWTRVLERAREGAIRAVSIVGGGAAGVEMALAIDHRFRAELAERAPHVRILMDTAQITPEFAPGARRRLLKHLRRRGIGVHGGNAVAQLEPGIVRTVHGHEFVSDAVLWIAGAAAHEWIRASALATDTRGFVLTNRFLQSSSHAEVFAAGDCATREDRPHAKAGVFAVRAGPVLCANLRAALGGAPLQPHISRARFLALVSTGRRHAVGIWNGISWEGGWNWRIKDRIDRGFVGRYSQSSSIRS